jgi:hypothetical protein
MRWAALVLAFAALLFPAAAAAENTPDGPATLISNHIMSIGTGPGVNAGGRVLTSWTVTVGPGGRGGTVRPLVGGVAGDPVELPATPGTYTFPLAHTRSAWPLGLVQTTGGHAIVTREACRPAIARELDPCESKWVDIQRTGQSPESDRGAQLAIEFDGEPDADGDLRGDLTEDRTDLRVAAVPSREPDGRLRVEVTLTNLGSIPADRPSLDASWLASARWEGACLPDSPFPRCASTPLAAGESRVFVVRAEDPLATSLTINARSEGADLAPADNSTVAGFLPAPAFDLVAAKSQHLHRGIEVQVRGVAAGPARVTAAFKVRGHTIKLARTVELQPYVARTVTLRAGGAKLRSLRRHAPVKAVITVGAVTTTTVVR